MFTRKFKKINTGFTLIELLVVISIIALLLSILMPALGKVKDKARTTVCKTRLKQFSLALALYAEDNSNEYLLHQWDGSPGVSAGTGYWFGRIGPYFDADKTGPFTNEIMRCPSGESIKEFGDELVYGWGGTDYALQAAASPNIKLSGIRQPYAFATFFDFYYKGEKNPVNDSTGSIYSGKWYKLVKDNRNAEFYKDKIYRHYSKKGINALYADSHVDRVVKPDWWKDLASSSSFGWSDKSR